jgi:hypothetical protein
MAATMPIMRVSTSVARINRRTSGSSGAVPVATGADELMGVPRSVFLRRRAGVQTLGASRLGVKNRAAIAATRFQLFHRAEARSTHLQ